MLGNETPVGFFQSNRGLRQEDPFSSYLFVLALKTCNCLLKSAREEHVLGFKVSGRGDEGVEVSHRCSLIAFFIFCEASQKQALCLSWIFLWFETISGLKINLDSP